MSTRTARAARDLADSPRRIGVGTRARAIRMSRGLSIAEAAREVGMGTGALCDFENGKRRLRTDTLVRLARWLNLPPASLLEA